MDTKLKKSKQIRAIIYRAISFGVLIMTLLSATTGYKALTEVFANQHYQLFKGDITGVTEFQQYIGKVYNDGMIAFTGVGDDKGYPLEDSGTKSIKDQATIDFYNAVAECGGNLYYYVYDHNYQVEEGEYTSDLHTNFTKPIFSEYDGHLILPEDIRLMFHQNGPKHELTSNGNLNLEYIKHSYMPNGYKAQDIDFVLAIKDVDILEGSGILSEFAKTATMYKEQLWFLSANVILLFITWIFNLATIRAAKTAKKDVAETAAHILVEIKLLLLAVIIVGVVPVLRHPFTYVGEKALIRVGLLAMLSYPIIWDFKNNGTKLFDCSVPVIVFNYMKNWGQSQPWKKRLGAYIGITGIGALVCAGIDVLLAFKLTDKKAILWISLLGVILLCISIYNAGKFFKEVSAITDKISDIRNGKLHTPLVASRDAFLGKTADDVNMLESGIETAVDQKSRADRMKVELITNVSHDLKTPLTSIINYVDLLCEEDMSPAAKDYVLALRDKSYKLKAMVQDVFDVSKASTGNMNVEKVVLDLGKLIRQTLADMDERIAESNLSFKVNLPEQPIYVEGDGEKLYRVFQNLFVNALQYSLDYSRVHVGLNVQGQMAVATVKNTSRGELNFDTSEITERFVRADASRTTEGSGLGLSIAKSFAEACGGEFAIETDADMFIAVLSFPLCDKPVEAEVKAIEEQE